MWLILTLICQISVIMGCSDFYMNFTNFKLSGRTLDLGSMQNWTITIWPRSAEPLSSINPNTLDDPISNINKESIHLFNWPAKYGTIGLSANWFGDDKWLALPFFGDSLNEKGLSCSCLALVGTQYQQISKTKLNIFGGAFCFYVSQNFENVYDLMKTLPDISIYSPDELAQHYVVRDKNGNSLVIELLNGEQVIYLDKNDGIEGFGIMTNEPTFNWHLENIEHYNWKRTLSRQAVSVPGNFYPEERYLRVYMMKTGMQNQGLMTSVSDPQIAFSLTVQVLNTVSVPMGNQYGTDSGDESGEGNADHTVWAIVRDHNDPTIYWRDAFNPTFRQISNNF